MRASHWNDLLGSHAVPHASAGDLFSTAVRFEIPFIVIQRREDLFTPTPVAIEYFEAVEAPRKAPRIIEGAAHFALVTHPQEFLDALTATLAGVVEPFPPSR